MFGLTEAGTEAATKGWFARNPKKQAAGAFLLVTGTALSIAGGVGAFSGGGGGGGDSGDSGDSGEQEAKGLLLAQEMQDDLDIVNETIKQTSGIDLAEKLLRGEELTDEELDRIDPELKEQYIKIVTSINGCSKFAVTDIDIAISNYEKDVAANPLLRTTNITQNC